MGRLILRSSGTGGTVSHEADWTARSTAAGVSNATDFRASGTPFTNFIFPNTEQSLVSRDTSEFISGSACCKTDVPSTAGGGAPEWIFPMDSTWTLNSQGMGTGDWYVQMRIKLGTNRDVPSNGGGGYKIFIVGGLDLEGGIGNSNSHTNHEFVISTAHWSVNGGIPSPYFETGNGTPPLWEPNGGGGDLFLQPAGNLACTYNSVGSGLLSCWHWPINEWFTVYFRVRIATYGGSTGNQMDLYVARQGQHTYDQLFASRNFAVGALETKYTNGNNCVTLTPYDTGRIDSTVSTFHKYGQIIVSRNPIACPLDF